MGDAGEVLIVSCVEASFLTYVMALIAYQIAAMHMTGHASC